MKKYVIQNIKTGEYICSTPAKSKHISNAMIFDKREQAETHTQTLPEGYYKVVEFITIKA